METQIAGGGLLSFPYLKALRGGGASFLGGSVYSCIEFTFIPIIIFNLLPYAHLQQGEKDSLHISKL